MVWLWVGSLRRGSREEGGGVGPTLRNGPAKETPMKQGTGWGGSSKRRLLWKLREYIRQVSVVAMEVKEDSS